MRSTVAALCLPILLCFFLGYASADETALVAGKAFPCSAEELSLGQVASASTDQLICELRAFPHLRTVTLGGLKPPRLSKLMEAFPAVCFHADFRWFGQEYHTGMTHAKITKRKLKDADLTSFLHVMTNLQQLDLFAYRPRLSQMEKRMEAYPHIRFGWTVPIADRLVRSDATAFSSLKGGSAKRYDGAYYDRLRYCPDLLALDLGHNKIENLDFLQYFPHLKVLILADNQIRDLTPLVDYVPELTYLELFLNDIVDITPLQKLKNLRHLNIAHNQVEDLSPLLEMPSLARCWAAYNRHPQEQEHLLQEQMPQTHFEFSAWSSTGAGWRSPSPYYEAIDEMFHRYRYVPLPE